MQRKTLFYGHEMTFKYSWILHLLKVPTKPLKPNFLSHSFSQSFSAPFRSLGSGPIIATLLLCTLLSLSLKIPHSFLLPSQTNTASTHTLSYFLHCFDCNTFLFNLLHTHLVLGAKGPTCGVPETPLSFFFPSSSRVFWPLFRYSRVFLFLDFSMPNFVSF